MVLCVCCVLSVFLSFSVSTELKTTFEHDLLHQIRAFLVKGPNSSTDPVRLFVL